MNMLNTGRHLLTVKLWTLKLFLVQEIVENVFKDVDGVEKEENLLCLVERMRNEGLKGTVA
jgi:hypothetical protein